MTKELFNEIKENFDFYRNAKVSCALKHYDDTEVVTGRIKDWGEGSYEV